jgi:Fe-S-cluster containining protein
VNKEVVSTPCFRCGVCCTKYQVYLTLIEARRIADELGLTWEEWVDRYTSQSWAGSDSFLLRRCNGACVFLERVKDNNITRCLIQPFKPSACREWNPSLYQRDCQEGLAKYWGLTVSPLGQPEGTDQDRRRFLSFLESLALAEDTDPQREIRQQSLALFN